MNSNYGKLLILSIVSVGILCLVVFFYLSSDMFTQNSLLIQGTEMSNVKIPVSVDDTHLSQIEQISHQLESSGMNVEQTLSIIGIINGSIEYDKLDSLYKIEGVKNVELQQTYQLAPPNSGLN